MQPPDRVTVPTCIGCGAMGEFGTCDGGCTEEKLELVLAVHYDRLTALAPCLGICIWRPTDWVKATLYEQERARALAERDTEEHLRGLLRRVAFVTPRDGQWERGWRLQETQARKTLKAAMTARPATSR